MITIINLDWFDEDTKRKIIDVISKNVHSTRPSCPFCKKVGLTGQISNNKTICCFCGQTVDLNNREEIKE